MKKAIRRMLTLLAVMTLAASAAAEEDFHDRAEVLELAEAKGGKLVELTAEEDPMLGPKNNGYHFKKGEKSPSSYVDPSISVNIGTGRIYKTNYMYARVKIASPYQIRTMTAAKTLQEKSTVLGTLLAKRVKAVVAVNGVLEADVTSESDWARVDGPVILQGETLRPGAKTSEQKIEKWKEEEGFDTLVIDTRGDLRVMEAKTWGEIMEEIESLETGAVNVFSFGPALVLNGEARYGYENRQMSSNRPAQRMAICQTGPLEYLLISTEGPEDPGSTGLKLDQLVELLEKEFPDVITAYNLDGGSSSTLVFRKGSEKWAKINCPKSGKKRGLRDIIYFASAWKPSK